MRIRTLIAGEEDLALPLLEAQYREHRIALGGAPLRRALRQLLRSPERGAVLVACAAAPLGIAALGFTFSLEHAGAVAWLEELYVVPAARGRGVGGALLARGMRAAKRRGCVRLELEVVRGHERAARLYLRAGFARLPRLRYSRPL